MYVFKEITFLTYFTTFLLWFCTYSACAQFLITDYGAIPDGKTHSTEAIQKTIDVCAQKGGGVVIIPEGTFISGALFLKQGVSIHIKENGVLKGSADKEDYPYIDTRWEGTEMSYMSAFINANELTDVKITGKGTIDGSGDLWLQKIKDGIYTGKTKWVRPRLLGIQNCLNVEIADLQLHNQAVWCVHILCCENVVLNNLHITADHNIPSSDGIDIDSSKDVTIKNCYIDVNDDCISIKSGKDEDGLRVNRPSEKITIQNCHFAYGHGGVAMGSETSGGIKDVLITDCIADSDNWAPIRFKSQPSRGGVVENITYQNFTLNNTRKAVEFNMAWRMVNPKPAAKILPVVKNVKLINIHGKVDTVGDIHGLEGSPIQGVQFINCTISANKGLFIEHAQNLELSGLHLQVTEGKPIIQQNVN